MRCKHEGRYVGRMPLRTSLALEAYDNNVMFDLNKHFWLDPGGIADSSDILSRAIIPWTNDLNKEKYLPQSFWQGICQS